MGGAAVPFRRRGADGAGARHGAVRDAGTGALAGGEPALGDEVAVGVGDGVTGQGQVGGEGTGRRQPGAGGQPAGAHGLAQGAGEGGAHAARTGQVEVQVPAESGPRFCHGNGPYRWTSMDVASYS